MLLKLLYIISCVSLTTFSFALAQVDSLDIKLLKCKNANERVELLAKIASEETSKNVDKSNAYANRALKELKTINSTKSAKIACGIYRTLAINYYYNGNNDSSILACNKALLLAKKLKDSKEIADAYLCMQTAYRESGKYEKAVEVSSLALKYYEKDKNLKGQAKATLNIGILYDDQKQFSRALDYLNQAKLLFIQLKDTAQIANAITRAANVYKDTRSQDTAKAMYLDALKLFESIQHKRGIAVIYNNLAGLNDIISSEEALNYYDKALKARVELGDKVSVCMIYNNIGAVYMNDKKYAKAIEYLNKGLAVANEIDSKQNLLNIYHALAGTYRRSNRLEEAYSMLFKYASLKDSLFNKESIEKIEEIQTKYETEKKEQEIALLNNTNALKELEINKNKIEISKQNQEKVFIALALLFFIGISIAVFRSYRITKKSKETITLQKKEIELQKNEVDEKQKEIVDSINYAKRIQYALLASEDLLADNLNSHFVLFKPKDIVSGDFYWATSHKGKFYLAVCDSTGHGVPGAFMSLLNIGFLSEAIKEKEIVEPNKIFDYVRNRLIDSIGKEEQQDGMDGILLCFDKLSNTISYAAANSAPILISRNNLISELVELPKDKMPVGKGGKNVGFNLYHIQAQKDDRLYLYTDGYADQFGGEKGKKFKYKQLNELLIENSSLELYTQVELLDQKFTYWKGNLEQVDDVLIIGLKI